MSAKTAKTQTSTTPRAPDIGDLRSAIDKAETQGIARDDMLLHLTLRDESMIKRSRSVGVDEVSFADGQMRFVGVKVVAASGGTSSLEAPAVA
ncbi:MAG TPA: hypothetical protein VE309_02235 [Caulobacteraceae bacterium]|jgi:hypothetical protein|nr:hypothetical protein [Caulobacteraceae bacterium]